MRKVISKIILDLYDIKENPSDNLDTLVLILQEIEKLGLKVATPSDLLESARVIRQNKSSQEVFSSLHNCVSRFLSKKPD